MVKINNIPLNIEVKFVRECIYIVDGKFNHSHYQVTIDLIYHNGTHKLFYSSLLLFTEYSKVISILSEKDRFDFVTSDLFLLKFSDHT